MEDYILRTRIYLWPGLWRSATGVAGQWGAATKFSITAMRTQIFNFFSSQQRTAHIAGQHYSRETSSRAEKPHCQSLLFYGRSVPHHLHPRERPNVVEIAVNPCTATRDIHESRTQRCPSRGKNTRQRVSRERCVLHLHARVGWRCRAAKLTEDSLWNLLVIETLCCKIENIWTIIVRACLLLSVVLFWGDLSCNPLSWGRTYMGEAPRAPTSLRYI